MESYLLLRLIYVCNIRYDMIYEAKFLESFDNYKATLSTQPFPESQKEYFFLFILQHKISRFRDFDFVQFWC